MLFRSNDTATTEIYTEENTLSLHDALPICWVTLTLPSGAPNSFQNQSSTLSYAFTGTQRAATNK